MLKYYVAERARHADVQAVTLTFPQCEQMIDMLCCHFGMPRIPVKLRTGGSTSHFIPPRRRYSKRLKKVVDKGLIIRMLPSMLQARTTCHEWAHYAHYLDHKGSSKPRVIHGEEHKAWMEKAVEFVKSTILYQQAKNAVSSKRMDTLKEIQGTVVAYQFKIDKGLAADVNPVIPVGPIQAAFDALPDALTCPKCAREKHKSHFGVRVMSRDAANVPTKIVRQSYCRSCR